MTEAIVPPSDMSFEDVVYDCYDLAEDLAPTPFEYDAEQKALLGKRMHELAGSWAVYPEAVIAANLQGYRIPRRVDRKVKQVAREVQPLVFNDACEAVARGSNDPAALSLVVNQTEFGYPGMALIKERHRVRGTDFGQFRQSKRVRNIKEDAQQALARRYVRDFGDRRLDDRTLIYRKYGAVVLALNYEYGHITDQVSAGEKRIDQALEEVMASEHAHRSEQAQHMLRTGIREKLRAEAATRDENTGGVRTYNYLDVVRLSHLADIARTAPLSITNLANHINEEQSEQVIALLQVHDGLRSRLDRGQRRILRRNFPKARVV